MLMSPHCHLRSRTVYSTSEILTSTPLPPDEPPPPAMRLKLPNDLLDNSFSTTAESVDLHALLWTYGRINEPAQPILEIQKDDSYPPQEIPPLLTVMKQDNIRSAILALHGYPICSDCIEPAEVSALHAAVTGRCREVAEFLLLQGTDRHRTDGVVSVDPVERVGRTPLPLIPSLGHSLGDSLLTVNKQMAKPLLKDPEWPIDAATDAAHTTDTTNSVQSSARCGSRSRSIKTVSKQTGVDISRRDQAGNRSMGSRVLPVCASVMWCLVYYEVVYVRRREYSVGVVGAVAAVVVLESFCCWSSKVQAVFTCILRREGLEERSPNSHYRGWRCIIKV